MTPHQIQLVKSSYAAAMEIGSDTVASLFYDRLFEVNPQLRKMFAEDMTEQRAKLMSMLTVAVRGLENFDAMRPALANLGAKHLDYGVQADHYDMVAQALLETLTLGLRESFDEPTREAWVTTLVAVRDAMIGDLVKTA